MAKFENIIKNLEYHVGCEKATILLGTKGIFGATYAQAAEAQKNVDELEEAISLLKANQ